MRSVLLPVFNVITAARIWKNVPLLFIFLAGWTVGGIGTQWEIPVLCVISIAFASAFMTHLNIITDRELDLIKKPHLYKMLSSDRRIMNIALIIELIVPLLMMFYLALRGYFYTSGCIFAFLIITILYSYNIFSREPRKNRLKVFWHGHFIVLMIGYLALWFSGYFINSVAGWECWLPVFAGISLTEYGLFLFESAIDADEEKMHKLRSLSVILGQAKTTYAALVTAASGLFVLLLGAFMFQGGTLERKLVVFAFIPPSLVISGILLTAVVKRSLRVRMMASVPDLAFNLGRIYILLTCILIKYLLE